MSVVAVSAPSFDTELRTKNAELPIFGFDSIDGGIEFCKFLLYL